MRGSIKHLGIYFVGEKTEKASCFFHFFNQIRPDKLKYIKAEKKLNEKYCSSNKINLIKAL
jgi:hypothetical protein